jgi:hypothetical protein
MYRTSSFGGMEKLPTGMRELLRSATLVHAIRKRIQRPAQALTGVTSQYHPTFDSRRQQTAQEPGWR